MTLMPTFYHSSLGLPLRWQDEQSMRLPNAVLAYLENRTQGTPIRQDEVELLRDYLQYYIAAPCWSIEGMEEEMARLRERVATLASAEEIEAWICECLNVGMDPL